MLPAISRQRSEKTEPRAAGSSGSQASAPMRPPGSLLAAPAGLRAQRSKSTGTGLAPRHQEGIAGKTIARSREETAAPPAVVRDVDALGAPGMKGRLVVVSNRIPQKSAPNAGGLTVALGDVLPSMKHLWLGHSGRDTGVEESGAVHDLSFGGLHVRGIDIEPGDYHGYYNNYSNSVLWPASHGLPEFMDSQQQDLEAYRRVNAAIAKSVGAQLAADDVVWVQDYQLIPQAQELKALGHKQRIAYFSHVPLPAPEVWSLIPGHEDLTKALSSYDQVGLQSQLDLANYRSIVQRSMPDDADAAQEIIDRACVLPIGIDVDKVREKLNSAGARTMSETLSRHPNAGRQLIIGVDRQDYSKGLPEKLDGLERFFEKAPEFLDKAWMYQVAPLTREKIPKYKEYGQEIHSKVGKINARFNTLERVPLVYTNNAVSHDEVMALYRNASVAMVTPRADGMNLVAKEFIAAQDPNDPGVLILSRFAGAASQLQQAIQVDPCNREEVADAIHRAVTMPPEERKMRFDAMLHNLKTENVHAWRKRALSRLLGTGEPADAAGPSEPTPRQEPTGSRAKAASAAGASNVRRLSDKTVQPRAPWR